MEDKSRGKQRENRVLHKNIYWLAASLGRVKIKIEISAKEMLKNAKEITEIQS